MSFFKECTLQYNGDKVFLNLALAYSIQPSTYQKANAIVTYPDGPNENTAYYVTETYEELKQVLLRNQDGDLLYQVIDGGDRVQIVK